MCRLGLREEATCDRCNDPQADFLHLTWWCPGVSHFWEKVFQEISKILRQEITPDPALVLLGYSKNLPKATRRLVDMALLVAKRRVAMCWLRRPVPTNTQWSKDLLYCCTQSENYSELLSPRSRPKNFWGLYNIYLKAAQYTATADTSVDTVPPSPN